MNDIKDPRLLWIKGSLFVVLGLMALGILVLLTGNISVFIVALIAIWAFCRAYYFAFYVIEHYIDSRFRFAGLISALNYCLSAKFSAEGMRQLGHSRSHPAGATHGNDTTTQTFVNAPVLKSSRWYAIRCWLLLLFSPAAIAAIHELSGLFDSSENLVLLVWDFAVIGAWLNVLSLWMVRGTFPVSWRLLIGCSAALLGSFLFSTFPFVFSHKWRNSYLGCVDLRVLITCADFFLTSLVFHFLASLFTRTRLEDQLLSKEPKDGNRQMSIRYLLILTGVSAIQFLIVTRTRLYSPPPLVKEILDVACFVSVGAISSVLITNLLVAWMLAKVWRRSGVFCLMIIGWALVCPTLINLVFVWRLGTVSSEEIWLLTFISWSFCGTTALFLYCLRRSGVFLTNNPVNVSDSSSGEE
jgi:hypothetical protein